MKKINNLIAGVIVGGLLLGVLVGSVVSRIYNKKIDKIENTYQARDAKMNREIDSLRNYNDSLDIVLAHKTYIADSLYKLDLVNKRYIAELRQDLIDAVNWIFDNGSDSNYVYLQNRYPTKDTLEYPFAGDQVTSITADIVKGDYLDSICKALQDNDMVLRKRILNHLGTIQVLEQDRDDLNKLIDDLYSQIATRNKDIKLKDEQVVRLRKILAGSISANALLLTFLLLL